MMNGMNKKKTYKSIQVYPNTYEIINDLSSKNKKPKVRFLEQHFNQLKEDNIKEELFNKYLQDYIRNHEDFFSKKKEELYQDYLTNKFDDNNE